MEIIPPDQPVIVGRYGKAVETGNRNGYSDPMSQEAQARYLYQRYDAIKGADVAGSFVWSFDDWRGDRPMLTVQSNTPDLYTQGSSSSTVRKKLPTMLFAQCSWGKKLQRCLSDAFRAVAGFLRSSWPASADSFFLAAEHRPPFP